MDLWKANEIVLIEAGVKKEHISVTDIVPAAIPDYCFLTGRVMEKGEIWWISLP
ncbi:MAG: hypothetical protein V8R80_03835 [Eubacterium sp.]